MNHHPPSDERDPPRKDEEAPRPDDRVDLPEEANETASPVCYANAPELREEFREDGGG